MRSAGADSIGFINVISIIITMVVVLENYRGFQIRMHRRLMPVEVEFPLGLSRWKDFVYRVICVNCPEGTDRTYEQLSHAVLPYMPWHGLREQDRYYICSSRGPCDEDARMVISIGCAVSSSEDSSVVDTLITQVVDYHKKAIDSLWNKAMQPEE